MKRICVYLVFLVSAAAAPSLTAQDAATEAKEGDVEHWIEYYKKERGLSIETVTDEEGTPEAASQEAGDGEHGASSTRPDAPDPAD
jgi:hypothetical protein